MADDLIEDPRALMARVRRRVDDMLKNKYGDAEIITAITEMGMDPAVIPTLLDEVKRKRVVDKKKAAIRGAFFGGIWLVVSSALLGGLFVYDAAMAIRFRILWLAAGVGVYLIGSNLLTWRNAKP